jgi:thiosulfate reductase cytochrome b subunit
MRQAVLKGYIANLLLVMVALYLLTGFGVTYPGLVTPLTLGLLGKAQASEIHVLLWGPFIILVLIHVYLGLKPKKS